MGDTALIPSLGWIKWAWEGWKQFRSWQFKKKWEKLERAANTARRDSNLYRFLKKLYSDYLNSDYLILEDPQGMTYPVAIFPAPESQWSDLESVLSKPLIRSEETSFLVKDENYLDNLKRIGRKLENRATYRLLNLQATGGNITIKASLGTYFDTVKTSHVLTWELLTRFGKRKPQPSEFKEFFTELALRKKLHDGVCNPLIDGDGRSAAIGVSMLIIYRNFNDTGYQALLKERSRHGVAVDTDLYHVVPSFMFQPVREVDRDMVEKLEFNVRVQVYREYLEEVFNVEEEEAASEAISIVHGSSSSAGNLQYLNELLEDANKAQLLFTGMAVDLLSLRPEICTLLLIKTPEWQRLHSGGDRSRNLTPIHINEEFKTPTELRDLGKDAIISFDLGGPELSVPPDVQTRIRPESITAPGAAAFFMGLDIARKVLAGS